MKLLFDDFIGIRFTFALVIVAMQITICVSQDAFPICYAGSVIDVGNGERTGRFIVRLKATSATSLNIRVQSTLRDRIANFNNITIRSTQYDGPKVYKDKSGNDPKGGSRSFTVTSLWTILDSPGGGSYFINDMKEDYGWDLGNTLNGFNYNDNDKEVYAPYNDATLILHYVSCVGFRRNSGLVYLGVSPKVESLGEKQLGVIISITSPGILALMIKRPDAGRSGLFREVRFTETLADIQPVPGTTNKYFNFGISVGSNVLSNLDANYDWVLPTDGYQFFFNDTRREMYVFSSGMVLTLTPYRCSRSQWSACIDRELSLRPDYHMT